MTWENRGLPFISNKTFSFIYHFYSAAGPASAVGTHTIGLHWPVLWFLYTGSIRLHKVKWCMELFFHSDGARLKPRKSLPSWVRSKAEPFFFSLCHIPFYTLSGRQASSLRFPPWLMCRRMWWNIFMCWVGPRSSTRSTTQSGQRPTLTARWVRPWLAPVELCLLLNTFLNRWLKLTAVCQRERERESVNEEYII